MTNAKLDDITSRRNSVSWHRHFQREASPLLYDVSNEDYRSWARTSERISLLDGIERAVMVCGGGDQALYLISLLQRNNNPSKVEVVDRNPTQLENIITMSRRYNKGSGTIERRRVKQISPYEKDEKKASDYLPTGNINPSFLVIPSTPGKKAELSIPEMRKPVKLELYKNDIMSYIRNIAESDQQPKKHFVYLSNVPTFVYGPSGTNGWMSYFESQQLFRTINESDKFKDGTMVVVVSLQGYEPHVLEKIGGVLVETEAPRNDPKQASTKISLRLNEGRYTICDENGSPIEFDDPWDLGS